MGGKEAASPRYIFTNLSPLTRVVFNEHDDALLTLQEDEGMKIEPLYYAPILPALLINGTDGIGTGWSTSIPCYNPFDIITNIENRLKDDSHKFQRMYPWFKNFLGEITESEGGNFLVKGNWRKIDKTTIEITELPIKKWTRDYKNFIEELMISGDLVEDLKEFHKDNTVHFVLKLKDDVDKIEKREGGIHKQMKLTSSISCNNFVLFDKDHKIKRYENETQILEEFFEVRLELYKNRKGHMMRLLEKEIAILKNKARFI
jgi:DNA topoisomerase-2